MKTPTAHVQRFLRVSRKLNGPYILAILATPTGGSYLDTMMERTASPDDRIELDRQDGQLFLHVRLPAIAMNRPRNRTLCPGPTNQETPP
jgi:hypothetical protein